MNHPSGPTWGSPQGYPQAPAPVQGHPQQLQASAMSPEQWYQYYMAWAHQQQLGPQQLAQLDEYLRAQIGAWVHASANAISIPPQSTLQPASSHYSSRSSLHSRADTERAPEEAARPARKPTAAQLLQMMGQKISSDSGAKSSTPPAFAGRTNELNVKTTTSPPVPRASSRPAKGVSGYESAFAQRRASKGASTQSSPTSSGRRGSVEEGKISRFISLNDVPSSHDVFSASGRSEVDSLSRLVSSVRTDAPPRPQPALHWGRPPPSSGEASLASSRAVSGRAIANQVRAAPLSPDQIRDEEEERLLAELAELDGRGAGLLMKRAGMTDMPRQQFSPPTVARQYEQPEPEPAPTAPVRGGSAHSAKAATQKRDSARDTNVSLPAVGQTGGQTKIPFSNKRAVEYKPYTLKDFRSLPKPTDAGKLRPDLNDPELQEKREKQLRAMRFAEEARALNIQKQQSKPELPKEAAPKEPSKRDKALEFAKKVPRPAVRIKKEFMGSQRESPVSEDAEDAALRELTQKHQEGRDAVEAIRRELGL